jgi:hypothetical protein
MAYLRWYPVARQNASRIAVRSLRLPLQYRVPNSAASS